MKKEAIDNVKKFFESQDYQLVSAVYVNAHSKLWFQCPRGHLGHMGWFSFKSGYRCAECAGNKKLTIEQVRQAFEKERYRLTSTNYINSSSKLDYVCPQGHEGSIRWDCFKQGERCAECAGNKKKTINQVRRVFEQEGCELLTDVYVSAHSKLWYLCPLKHKTSTTWADFQTGYRCWQCDKISSISRGESKLGVILKQIFPTEDLRAEDNLGFLGHSRVDYSIRQLCLAFEYDGLHHFRPVAFGGIDQKRAEQQFIKQRERDRRKNRLCKKNNITLIRIAYKEPLDVKNIKAKIERVATNV